MTYVELKNEPFNYHPEMIRRSLKTLLSRGFIKIVHQGGGYKKDKNIYGISDNWRIWEPGKDFSPKKKDAKRGFQGKGLGRYMMQYLISQANNAQIKQLFLEVRKSNLVAISLYKSLDFYRIGIRKNYYRTPSGREDAIVMQLEIIG